MKGNVIKVKAGKLAHGRLHHIEGARQAHALKKQNYSELSTL